jgi:hypothetical protein
MTNKELTTIFDLAELNAENIFDTYDFLKDYEESYKEMQIANIKPTIYDAYELYCSHKNNVVEAVKYILDEADFSSIIDAFSLTNLFESIPEEYRSIFKQLIEENLDK